MATSTVGGFLAGLRTLLLARPALTGVAVHPADLGILTDADAIVFGRVTMSAARFLGWGAGEASLATIEPLTLTGAASSRLPGNGPTDVLAAYDRADLLRTEVMQQLRDDPTIANELVAPQRLQPPLMTSAVYGVWRADEEGSGTFRARVDFRIDWQAIT